MSRNLNTNSSMRRNYGAIPNTNPSSSGNAAQLPDVNFADGSAGFSPTEFMSLSEDIALNITSVHASWRQLEKISKIIGTSRDKKSTRDEVHNINSQTNQRIEATSKDLERLTSIVRRGDKQQKLQLEKLAGDFKSAVEKYSATQKRLSEAMKRTYSQQMLSEEASSSNVESSQQQALLQQQIDAGLQFEHQVLLERQQQILQIEADVLDVNAIMQKLSETVHQQGENVERIETSIETTAANVELGREELQKAAQSRQSYRRKVLILLVIAVIIGLIVTGIIVGKLK